MGARFTPAIAELIDTAMALIADSQRIIDDSRRTAGEGRAIIAAAARDRAAVVQGLRSTTHEARIPRQTSSTNAGKS